MVYRKFNIKYCNHHLSFLNLDTLESRRIKYNLIPVFKIIHSLVDLKLDTFFSIISSFKLYQLRWHTLHLNKSIPPGKLIRPIPKISTWNQLPSDIVISESLALFKQKLNCYNIAKIFIFKLWFPSFYIINILCNSSLLYYMSIT